MDYYLQSVYRDREENTVSVDILKVKFKHLGECGSARFKYNTTNGRYIPFIDVPSLKWDYENYLLKRKKAIEENIIQSGFDFTSVETRMSVESEFLLPVTPKDEIPF